MKPDQFAEDRSYLHCNKLLIILLTLLVFLYANTTAQTLVGSGQTYTTLKSAFDAINNGALTGEVVIHLTSSTTETATASLNASGSGSASYTSVTIYPTGSGYSINGNLSAPLITLNGADNVTIDGRVNQSGNKNLVITNSNTGTASETSTLCLQNSAENNIIKYCHLRGSTGCTTAGIVFFSTSSSGNGNDNNRIEYCDITKEGTTGALCAVYSKGNSGYVNSGNIITGNEIYDVMRNDATYMGICIYYYSDAWTVSANSFFETMSRLMTASATSYFIYVNTINGSYKTGSSFYISANYMGGTAPQCGGSSLSIDANGTSYSMYGIYITNDTNVTSVQENTIRNITITRSGISGDFFNGIYLLEGKFEVGTSSRNYVGESSGNSSITISGSSTSVYKSRGIYFKGSGISSANISNNVIGSINATGSESGPHAFWGIYYENSNENNIYAKSYILNNQIGSTVTSKSILLTNRSNASGNAVELGGIWNVSWSHLTVTGNTIFNLYNNDSSNTYSFTYGMKNTWYGYYNVRNNIIGNITTTSKRQHAQPNQYIITGILHEAAYTATSDTIFICDNKVFGIYSLYNGSVNSYISGMYFVNYWYPNITKISGNLFYNLSLEATGSDSRIIGIEFGSCSESNKWYVFNNVINLGKGVNKNCEIYGIYLNGQGKDSLFINNNSVYIGGSAITPWNASTYCIRQVWDYFSPSTYKLVLMNNVFYNARSNPDPGNSAKHYAITFWSSNMKIDYNDYYAPGTGGVMAHVGADYNTLSGLKAVTLQDNYSVNDNPYFLTDSTLKIDSTNSGCWNVYKKGTQIQNITSDYRGLPRSNSVLNGSVCIGANEFTTLTTPPVAIASGAPSSGGTTYYSQSNRRLFEIIWGASLKKPESGGKTKKNSGKSSSYKSQDRTLPSTVSLQYYSGQTPPDTANIPVAKIGKGYYFIDTDRDPANSFSVKVYWGDHELGNITDTSKIILAMYDIKRKYWIPFYRGFSGNNVSIVDHSAKTLTVNGLTRIDNVRFAFTDKDQPLLSSSMAGDYTVGVSTEGNYTTLTSALNEVKIRGISGAVRFLLIDTLYSSDETFPLIIDSIPGTSQTNSLTLKPNTGVLSVISGNNEGGILELNHCKYIIIDGSNEGKGKNLTIKNSSTSDTGGVTICLKNDASNNTIINCNIIGSSFSTNGIISFSDSTITTGCCNNKIENCSIYGGNSATTYGIVLTGNILKYGENNKILRNEIYDFSYCGISCDFFINTEIRGNNIYQTRTYSNETIYGIVLQYECKNTTISGNKICNFRSSQSYPNYYGILINSAGDTINIINNLVFPDTNYTRGNIYGITSSGYLNYLKIINNLVYISGEEIINGNSYCINIFRQSFDSVYNNILINKRSNGTGTGKHYGLYIDSAKILNNFVSNNNNIYIRGNGGILAYDGTANRNTISDWVTATGKDLSSYSVNTQFIPSTSFLIDSTILSSKYLYQKGRPFEIVPADYRGVPRSTSPLTGPTCVGPYEFEFTQSPNWFEGTIYVGSGEEIKTLTDTNGLFSKINNGIITGNLTVNITSDLSETGTHALNETNEELNYRIRIIPDKNVVRNITGTCNTGGLIRLKGADRITLDGRYNGTGNYLSIKNNSNSYNTAAIQIISGGSGAKFDTIRNCIFSNANYQYRTAGIHIGDSLVSDTEGGISNNNITLIDNTITNSYYGILAIGDSIHKMDSLIIQGNTIGSSDNYIGYSGIMLRCAYSPLVSRNHIFRVSNYEGAAYGIFIGNYVSEIEISRNLIHEIKRSGTTGNTTCGIRIAAENGTTGCKMYNNLIYDIRTSGNNINFDNPFGIRIDGGINHKIYYNSINMYGAFRGSSSNPEQRFSSAILISTGSVSGMDIRNNIFKNKMTYDNVYWPYDWPYVYAIYAVSGTTFSTIDYNDYYSSSSGAFYNLGFLGTDIYTLTDWKTVTGQDIHSISSDPLFKSDSYLIPYPSSPVLRSGAPLLEVTTDYTGSERNILNPSIGGYEAAYDNDGPVITYTLLNNTTSTFNRQLNDVYISDSSHVDTLPDTRPRLYFKRNTDSNTFFNNTSLTGGWKYVVADSNTGSPFSFTINYALLSGDTGVHIGTRIQYFVIAQDKHKPVNFTVNWGMLNLTASGVNLTQSDFPVTGNINSYKIIDAAMSGDYHISLNLFNQISRKNISFEKKIRKVLKYIPVNTDENLDIEKNSSRSDIISKEEIKYEDSPDLLNQNVLNVASSELAKGKKIKYEWREIQEEYSVPVEKDDLYKGDLFFEYEYEKSSSRTKPGKDIGRGVYATITAALADLKDRGVSGAVNLILDDTLYSASETFPLVIDTVIGSSSVNKITIKPNNGVSSVISGAIGNDAIIKFYNTNYVTIDGSNNGTNSRNLTIKNTYTYNPVVVWFGSKGTGTIKYNTLKNTNIINGGPGTASAIVVGDGDNLFYSGFFSNITIRNNDISNAWNGTFVYAYSSTSVSTGYYTTVDSNTFNTPTDYYIMRCGIYTYGINYSNINHNTIKKILYPDYSYQPSGIFIDSKCYSIQIKGNIIDSVSAGIGAYGMLIRTGYYSNYIEIINNVIYSISSPGYSDWLDIPAGLMFVGNQAGIFILNNSINLFGNYLNQSGAVSVGIALRDNSYAYILNNSIVNTLGLQGVSGYGAVGIYVQSGNWQLPRIENNNYYINASSGTNTIGRIGSNFYSTLSAFRSASGGDFNSYAGNPGYLSNKNLLPDTTNLNCWNLYGKGMPLSAVAQDIRGLPRSTTIEGGPTCIGVYEFTAITNPPVATASGSPEAGDTTFYYQSERKLLEIFWGSGKDQIESSRLNNFSVKKSNDGSDDLPTNVNVQYFSGITPPDTSNIPVAKTGKVYWYIDADCDPVQPVDIKIFWGEQEIGNITDTSKLILAMYDMKTRVWLPFERGTSGNGYSIVNHTEKSITVNGIQRVDSVRFALTDKDFPLVSYRDTIAPVITYTPLGDTISKNSRILTATIYDSTGLPVSGSFQPRIYFRKNYNGSWVSTQGSKQVEKYSNVRLPEQELKYLKSESNIRKSDSDLNNTKNVTINTWNFTIDTSLIGQVNVGDSVFYYVIAQDIVTPSNIGSNPAGVVANDVNTIITHPATPSSFCIKDAIIIFEENFEESWTTPSTLNPAWSCPQTGDNEWHMSSYTTGWLSTNGGYIPKGADSTSQSARFHSYDGTGGTTGDLITPLIDFSPYPGIKKLQFYYINTTGNDFLNIYLSIDGGINYDTSLICLKIARLWTLFTIDLSTLNSQSVKIKFTATRVTSGSSDIGIDQIAVHNTDGPLSGIKTINPGGGGDNNYTSFTAAIDDLNLKGVGTGGVTFNVKDGSIYIENCPAIRSSGTLESQIIFQRDNTGNRPLIKPYNAGTQKSAGILIKGGDYITFDGIDVISNWGEIGAGFMITNATETDGAHYNTIKNSVIGDTGIYKITIGILQSSSIYEGGGVTPSSAEGTNSNNKYYNISVQKAGYGIWLHGDLVYKDSNCEIGSTTDSLITTIGAPVLGAISSNDYLLDVYGIYLIYQKDFKVFNTEVRNCRGYRNNDEVSGIKAVFCSGTSSIYNCKIHDIKTMSPYYQDPVYGICTNAYDSTAVINIHNNSVYAINHYDIQFPSQDMCVFGIYTSDIDAIVYNNSVRIDEDYKITSTAYRYNGLGSGYSLSIMNNVFANYSSGNSNSRRYCLDLNCGPPKQLNNNTYYIITGTNNYIGCINVQNCSTLSHWRTASGKENNSNFGEPGFLSVSNLLPDSTSYNCWYLYGKGMPIAEIETDIRGLSRSTIIATGPTCIGAYEFTTNTSPPVATASGSPVAGDTTFYTQSERDILSILWGTGGADKRYNGNSNENQKQIQNNNKSPKAGGFSWMKPEGISALPNTVSVQKFSGQKASEIDTAGWTNTAKRGSGYWKVAVDQQPTSTFAVTLYFGDEELGNISDPANNLILAKYDPNTHTWTPFPRTTDAGANWASYVDWPNRTVTVKGLTDFGGASLYSEFALTDQTAPLRRMRLDLTALIAGFYNDVSNTMVSDLITLELRTETSPYTLIDQSVISAGTTGGAVFYSYSAYTDRFTGSSIKYWIVFKHRNSLETWSVAGNAFNNVTGTMSYDFTTAITQAYGSNLIQKGTKYCIINGDADQDGSVGALDRSACWNNRNLSGYYSTDLDGDGSVGALDRSICWNYRNRTVQKPSLLDNNSKGNEIEKHNTKNGKEVLKGYDIKLDGSSTKKKTNNY